MTLYPLTYFLIFFILPGLLLSMEEPRQKEKFSRENVLAITGKDFVRFSAHDKYLVVLYPKETIHSDWKIDFFDTKNTIDKVTKETPLYNVSLFEFNKKDGTFFIGGSITNSSKTEIIVDQIHVQTDLESKKINILSTQHLRQDAPLGFNLLSSLKACPLHENYFLQFFDHKRKIYTAGYYNRECKAIFDLGYSLMPITLCEFYPHGEKLIFSHNVEDPITIHTFKSQETIDREKGDLNQDDEEDKLILDILKKKAQNFTNK